MQKPFKKYNLPYLTHNWSYFISPELNEVEHASLLASRRSSHAVLLWTEENQPLLLLHQIYSEYLLDALLGKFFLIDLLELAMVSSSELLCSAEMIRRTKLHLKHSGLRFDSIRT